MTPTRGRPSIPTGYGISDGDDGLLDWDRVTEALAQAEIYWFSTVAPAGDPHLVPLHAVAVDATISAAGDPETRWSRNLEQEPRVTVGIHQDGLQVIVRGKADLAHVGLESIKPINLSVEEKYGFSYGEEGLDMWHVTPSTVIAFDPATFATSPTRFRFEVK